MAITKFRVPDEAEMEFIRANGLDPDRVTVILKDENSMVLRNYRTNDDITIHASPKSKREFANVWK